jgi:hypothetical protein
MSKDKRTATQRIEDLERALMSLYQTADNMARDLMTVKDALKLLGNKLDATVKALVRDGSKISDEVISSIMVENNIEELKQKVNTLVQQGILTPAEEIIESSFIVGRDLGQDGTVVNPRMQFTYTGISPEVREKLRGAKPGQIIEFAADKNKFEVLEVYTIGAPAAPKEDVLEVLDQEASAESSEKESTSSEEAASS